MVNVILYAEDNDAEAMIPKKKFQEGGYEVKWAKDGLEAIEMYKKYTPDIVLLDERMPKMNGYEVAKEIRLKDMNTPIIFLSSVEEENISTNCLKLGAIDFIRKEPWRYKELLLKIQNAIQNFPVKKSPVINITPDTSVNRNSLTLTSFGISNRLHFRDCNLLQILLLNERVPVSRKVLLRQVWFDTEDESAKENMNKSISRLRNIMSIDKRIKITSNRGDSVVLEVDNIGTKTIS